MNSGPRPVPTVRAKRRKAIQNRAQNLEAFNMNQFRGKMMKRLDSMETEEVERNGKKVYKRALTDQVIKYCFRKHGIFGQKLRSEMHAETRLVIAALDRMNEIVKKHPTATIATNAELNRLNEIMKSSVLRMREWVGLKADEFVVDVGDVRKKVATSFL